MVGDDADDPSGDLKSLILDAFAVAKTSEKEDWHRMYAGVLKNRLLLLTNYSFHESQWGASGFTALLDTMPELVRVDRGTKPPTVELLDPAEVADYAPDSDVSEPVLSAERPVASVAPPDSRRWRIRKDLWDAVMAVRDPEAFVWDMGAVVRMSQDEAAEYEQSRLPTLTSTELDGWYRAFAHEQGASDSRYADLLKSWASNEIGGFRCRCG